MTNSTLEIEKEKPRIDRDYFVPNFGIDSEINDATKNLAETEK